MEKYLDQAGLITYDTLIKAYIEGVAGNTNGVRIITLNTAPTSSTLTYTVDGLSVNFKVGDEVRVIDNTKGTEDTNYYVVYKLYDINNGEAYWGLSGSGSGVEAITETAIISLTSLDYSSELIGTIITVTIDGTNTNYTWNGSPILITVPYGVEYSVATSAVSGFNTPSTVTINSAVMGYTREISLAYTYQEVSITIGTNQSTIADLVSNNAALSINGNNYSLTSSESASLTFTTHVATGTSVTFGFSNVPGYKSPVISTVTANSSLQYSVNYETTIVTCTSNVDSAGGKSSNDVSFTVSSTSVSSTNVASGGIIKIPTGETITITSTDLSSFGYGVSISPASGTTAVGTNMTFIATYAYGSVFTALILSNLSNDNSLSSETVTVNYDSVSLNLSNGDTLVIPPGKSVTCVFTNVNTDYKKPSNLTFTTVAGTNYDCTGKIYQTEVLTVTSITTDAGSVSGLTVTINGVTKTNGTDTLSWKIPFDASDVVTSTKSGFNVTITKNPNTDIADSVSKNVTIAFEEIKDGVYAITSSGVEVAYTDINTSNTSLYVGVVVRDTENAIEFFIDKRFVTGSATGTSNGNYKAWATNNYSVDISGITNITGSTGSGSGNYWSSSQIAQARTLHKNGETGIANTNKIVALYTSDTASNNAAKYCRSIANPITGTYNGYLGSAAEWIAVYENLTEINNTLSKIGGVLFSYSMSGDATNTSCWSSTEYSAAYAWDLYWRSDNSHAYFDYDTKSIAPLNYCARVFFPVS